MVAIVLPRHRGVGHVRRRAPAWLQEALKQVPVEEAGQVAWRFGGPAIATGVAALGQLVGAQAASDCIDNLGAAGEGHIGRKANRAGAGHLPKTVQHTHQPVVDDGLLHERLMPPSGQTPQHQGPIHQRQHRSIPRQALDHLGQPLQLLDRPYQSQHWPGHHLLVGGVSRVSQKQVLALVGDTRLAEERCTGSGPVGQDTPAEVHHVAAQRNVPVHVYVRAVHRRHRPVRWQVAGLMCSDETVSNLRCQEVTVRIVPGLFQGGCLGNVFRRFKKSPQPVMPFFPGASQFLTDTVQLEKCASQIKWHELLSVLEGAVRCDRRVVRWART